MVLGKFIRMVSQLTPPSSDVLVGVLILSTSLENRPCQRISI